MIKDNFFGRKAHLDILEKRISDLKEGYRQNIAIIGDELVGKTSIVFRFLGRFYDNRIITLYLEVRPQDLASFARKFIAVLLYNFLLHSGMPLEEDLEFLLAKSEKFIPRTTEKIKSILASLEKRKKNNIFVDLLSLCDSITDETGKRCVVIFDEFHNLQSLGIKNLYPDWSKMLITQKSTMYIIVSSMKFKARAILAKNLSLLFGNFEILTVEPFDIKDSEGFLGHLLGAFPLEGGLKNFLVNFTGGNPFYLELIARELLKSANADLKDLLESLLSLPSGILNQKFSNYLKCFLGSPYSQDYIAILHLISNGHNKIKDIAHLLRRQKKELMLRINYLLELDTLSRSGDFLQLNDRVFSFWLKFVHQEKMQSLTFDARSQKTLFRDKIAELIREFFINARKPISERTVELLRLFEDEVMQIDKKRIRLSHFREIKNLEFNRPGLKEGVIGRSHDNLWIIAFKQDLLTEEDIAEFARECKKYRHKMQRKIIIALKEVDPNTRLRAMEEKIWTWDLNRLNQLLDLFYKPRIIA